MLKGFLFEYNVEFSDYKQILLEIRKDKYYLLCNKIGNTNEVDITHKIEAFCKGMKKMNINDWNQKDFDYPMVFFQVSTGNFRFQLMIYMLCVREKIISLQIGKNLCC